LPSAVPLDHGAAFTNGGEAVGDDQPGIVVRVKFEVFGAQAHPAQLPENTRQVHLVVGQAESHRVADAELGAQIACTASMNGFMKSIGARRVFQMQTWANPRLDCHPHRIQISLRRLIAPPGLNL
jgi:hypothetical protein